MKSIATALALTVAAPVLAMVQQLDNSPPQFGAVLQIYNPGLTLAGTKLLIVDRQPSDWARSGAGGGGSRNTLLLIDTEAGQKLAEFRGHYRSIWSSTFSPDFKYVLTSAGLSTDRAAMPDPDHTARLWDIKTGREVRRFEGHRALVQLAQFSPNGRQVFTVSRDSTARLWEVLTGNEIARFDKVSLAKLGPDGRFVVGLDPAQRRLTIWDARSGKVVRQIEKPDARFQSTIDFNAAGDVLLTASVEEIVRGASTWSRHRLRTWDTATGRELQVFEGHWLKVTVARFLPDGKRLISGATDGTVRLWDAATGKEIRQIDVRGEVAEIAVAGRSAYIRWRPNCGTLWDIETGKKISDNPDIIAFSPDGKRFLTLDSIRDVLTGRPATWWDAETGKLIPRNGGDTLRLLR